MRSFHAVVLVAVAVASCTGMVVLGEDPAVPVPETSPLPGDIIESQPSPVPTATPVPTPEKAAPDLLPESGALPLPSAAPPAYAVPDLIPNAVAPRAFLPPQGSQTTAQKIDDAIRFRELRTAAERDPYAILLWRTADRTATIEGRRQYLRAYYRYAAVFMLKLEPRLANMIKAYGNTRLQSTIQHNIQPTIPSYKFVDEGRTTQKSIGSVR